MKQPLLNVLIVEDNPNDAELFILELENGGFQVVAQRVDTPQEFEAALKEAQWDIILSDYRMPQFNIPNALKILEKSGLDTPFIVISGTVGEDTAIECLKAGAHDFMVKGHLLRLIPAINRELKEAQNRKARREAEQSIELYIKKLEQSNKELEHFATIASHDLQTPLRKVQTFADIAKVALEEGKVSEGWDYLERMTKSAQQMQELISSLLNLSRITRKGKPFKQTDLSQVIEHVLEDLQENLQETHGQVEVGTLCAVEADESQMQQLFRNLIENALKFHKTTMSPSIKVYSKATGNNHCEVVVEDNGIGFEEAYKDKIFEVFQRLHGQQEYPGTGIGLSLVQKIVERHNGSILAESQMGIGSKFTVKLPLHQP